MPDCMRSGGDMVGVSEVHDESGMVGLKKRITVLNAFDENAAGVQHRVVI